MISENDSSIENVPKTTQQMSHLVSSSFLLDSANNRSDIILKLIFHNEAIKQALKVCIVNRQYTFFNTVIRDKDKNATINICTFKLISCCCQTHKKYYHSKQRPNKLKQVYCRILYDPTGTFFNSGNFSTIQILKWHFITTQYPLKFLKIIQILHFRTLQTLYDNI